MEENFACNGMDAREILQVITAQGAVLTNVREGVFYFYGNERLLPALQVDLESLSFVVRSAKAEPGRVATIHAVIDESWLAQMMPKLCAVSAKHKVEYDGWEASIPEAKT